jgi:predicted GH43/DUF377 family glycosyl hydrolase
MDSPSVLLSAKVEIMDFSMPSYDDATKGDTMGVKETPSVPSFSPFGSLSEPADDVEVAAPVVDGKAGAAAKKAEEKAAAEAKKAEEQAAAEAKKAEKEARRRAELEKQKEAVARASQKKPEETTAPVSSRCIDTRRRWLQLFHGSVVTIVSFVTATLQ